MDNEQLIYRAMETIEDNSTGCILLVRVNDEVRMHVTGPDVVVDELVNKFFEPIDLEELDEEEE